jgi:hypothetical protein
MGADPDVLGRTLETAVEQVPEGSGRKRERAVPIARDGPHFCPVQPLGLDRDDVLGRGAFGSLDDIELDLASFGEGFESLRLNRAVMDEAVFATVVRRDEPEAFLIVEPLYCSLGTHLCAPWFCESEPR